MARPIPDVAPITTATRSDRSKTEAISGHSRIRPAIVGENRGPAGSSGVLIVGIAAEALIKLAVFAQLFAVEPDTETGAVRYANGAVFVRHEAALNDVVREVMVVG